MAETVTPIAKTDADIYSDVQRLMLDIFSTHLSRDHIRFRVQDSVVILEGHMAAIIGYDVLLDNLSHIEGVVAIDDEALYNDDDLRMQISELLPMGIRVHIMHGAVALAGKLPTDADLQEIIGSVGELHGVVSVNTDAIRH